MLFGASTMTFYRRPLPRALEAIASCGFDYAEIWVDHAWDASCGGADAESIRAVLQRCGLRATVHCPILDINITSANRGIRAESIRQNLLAIDFTKSIGADLFVLHPGSRFSVRESVSDHWDYQIEALIKILAYARQRQVVAALENMDSAQETVSIQDRGDFKRLFAALGIKKRADHTGHDPSAHNGKSCGLYRGVGRTDCPSPPKRCQRTTDASALGRGQTWAGTDRPCSQNVNYQGGCVR